MLNSLTAPVRGEMQKHLVGIQPSSVKVERPCEPSHSNLSALKKGISFVILEVVVVVDVRLLERVFVSFDGIQTLLEGFGVFL